MAVCRYWRNRCYGCGAWICVRNCAGVPTCPACQARPELFNATLVIRTSSILMQLQDSGDVLQDDAVLTEGGCRAVQWYDRTQSQCVQTSQCSNQGRKLLTNAEILEHLYM